MSWWGILLILICQVELVIGTGAVSASVSESVSLTDDNWVDSGSDESQPDDLDGEEDPEERMTTSVKEKQTEPKRTIIPSNARRAIGWETFSDKLSNPNGAMDQFVCRCFCQNATYNVDPDSSHAIMDDSNLRVVFDPIALPLYRQESEESLAFWLNEGENQLVYDEGDKVTEYASGTLIQVPSTMTLSQRMAFLETVADKNASSYEGLTASQRMTLEASLGLNHQRKYQRTSELMTVWNRTSLAREEVTHLFDSICRHQCSHGVMRMNPAEWHRFHHLEFGLLKLKKDPFNEGSLISPLRPLFGLMKDQDNPLLKSSKDLKWLNKQKARYSALYQQIMAFDLATGEVDWRQLEHLKETVEGLTRCDHLRDRAKKDPIEKGTNWRNLSIMRGIFKNPTDLYPPSLQPKIQSTKKFVGPGDRIKPLVPVAQPHIQVTGDTRVPTHPNSNTDLRRISHEPTISRIKEFTDGKTSGWHLSVYWRIAHQSRMHHEAAVIAKYLWEQHSLKPSTVIKSSYTHPVESFALTPSYQLEAVFTPSPTEKRLVLERMDVTDDDLQHVFGMKLTKSEMMEVKQSMERTALKWANQEVRRKDVQASLKQSRAVEQDTSISKHIGTDYMLTPKVLSKKGNVKVVASATNRSPLSPLSSDFEVQVVDTSDNKVVHFVDGYKYLVLANDPARLLEIQEPTGKWREYYQWDKPQTWSPKSFDVKNKTTDEKTDGGDQKNDQSEPKESNDEDDDEYEDDDEDDDEDEDEDEDDDEDDDDEGSDDVKKSAPRRRLYATRHMVSLDPAMSGNADSRSKMGSHHGTPEVVPMIPRRRVPSYLHTVKLVFTAHLSTGCWSTDNHIDAQLFILGRPRWVEIEANSGDRVIAHASPSNIATDKDRLHYTLPDIEVIHQIHRPTGGGFNGVLANKNAIKHERYDDISETIQGIKYIQSMQKNTDFNSTTCLLSDTVVADSQVRYAGQATEPSFVKLPLPTRERAEGILSKCYGRGLPGSVIHRGNHNDKVDVLQCRRTADGTWDYQIAPEIPVNIAPVVETYFRRIGGE